MINSNCTYNFDSSPVSLEIRTASYIFAMRSAARPVPLNDMETNFLFVYVVSKYANLNNDDRCFMFDGFVDGEYRRWTTFDQNLNDWNLMNYFKMKNKFVEMRK